MSRGTRCSTTPRSRRSTCGRSGSRLGGAISGDADAYQYLHDSVVKFPNQKELMDLMRAVGFQNVDYRNLSGGIAALHWGIA